MAADSHLGYRKIATTSQAVCRSKWCLIEWGFWLSLDFFPKAFIHALLSRVTLASAGLSCLCRVYIYNQFTKSTNQLYIVLDRKRIALNKLWKWSGREIATSATNVVLFVVSTKAVSFHNRSSSNFAYRLGPMFSRIAPCRIFNLSTNLINKN